MKLESALFNWVSIRIVADARPNDRSAADTADFFATILREDHHLTDFHIALIDDTMVHVQYETEDGTSKRHMFDRFSAEQLLHDINATPQYNE